jgi:hypothetical protein
MMESAEFTGKKEEANNEQRYGKESSPPIIITATINLLKFQAEIKAISKGNFQLRNDRNGVKVITREMVDYLALKKYLEEKKISDYTFYPKCLTPI